MSHGITIKYREFYDVPRAIICSYRGTCFFLDCSFDEALDEYPDAYKVYVMPALTSIELKQSWENVPPETALYVGLIPVSEIQFDASRRKYIRSEPIDALIERTQRNPPASFA